jgi:cyanophycin synthetase
MGRAAAQSFDTYVCCSRQDLRGRAPHEVPNLLGRGLVEAGVEPGAIMRTDLEDEALVKVLAGAEAGDLVVVLSSPSDWARKRVSEFAPVRITAPS